MQQNYFFNIRLLTLFTLMLALLAGNQAQATHIRAGDIVARPIGNNPLQYEFRLVIYVDPGQAPQPVSTLFFGDGTSQTVPWSTNTNVAPAVNRLEFIYNHTYNAPGYYAASFNGENRNAGILNMNNSVQTSFYIQTEVLINPLVGPNQTPRMPVAPLDRAVRGQIFEHNPEAYDIEGDSLSYRLIDPRMSLSCSTCPPAPVSVANYTSPANPIHQGEIFGGGAPATFTIDPITGLIEWNTPGRTGEYNIAFVVEEWRLVQRGQPRIKMSVTTRDMQIIVEDNPNRPPEIVVPKDLCVLPGTVIQDTITVSDPDGDRVRLELFSPLPVGGNLTFTRIGNTDAYVFRWAAPTCLDVRSQAYQFVFKATDSVTSPLIPLTDFETWSIRVVGPPPTNVAAFPNGNSINLTWDPYSCPNGEYIKIYRRENPYPFIPDSCELGVPAYTGYVFLTQVPITATSFSDDNNGAGLRQCINYSYIMSVDFPLPAAGESYASNEAFTELEQVTPTITKVSVLSTDAANGSIQVNWQLPQVMPITPGPVGPLMTVHRAEGATGQGPYTLVASITGSAVFTDTTFTDTGLNTQDQVYSYRVDITFEGPGFFYSQSSETASSVRLTGTSGNQSIGLTWTYNTPWDNSSDLHFIFREIDGVFTLIDSVQAGATSGQYTDVGSYQNMPLVEKQTYCYYVITQGDYLCDTLPQNLLNNSQRICVFLDDLTAPCTPVLSLEAVDCENFTLTQPYTNRLKWRFDLSPGCDTSDVAYYTVFFTNSSATGLDSLTWTREQFYNHENLQSLAGCYAVSATDSSGNQSPRSNVVCQDNCIFFALPNIITPNGDNVNDYFRPSPKSRFVKSFNVIIFNRWGAEIYRSNRPDNYWNGNDGSGKRVPSGVYYYSAEVEFYTFDPADSRKTYKGWVEVVY